MPFIQTTNQSIFLFSGVPVLVHDRPEPHHHGLRGQRRPHEPDGRGQRPARRIRVRIAVVKALREIFQRRPRGTYEFILY